MSNVLFEKKYINDLQKSLNANNVKIYDFVPSNRISIGGITINKTYDEYCLILGEINSEFVKIWRSSICKYFIKDVKNSQFDLYKIVECDNLYFLLRNIDNEKLEDFVDVNYIDKKYAIVTISENSNFCNTYLPSFKLKNYFDIVGDYEALTICDNNEDNDEMTSKMLFEENDLSN